MSAKRSLHVLLIDDSIEDVILITRELSSSYKVVWDRVDSEAALIIAVDEYWDVILCDFHMPHLDVEHALIIVRDSRANADTPFIVISGVVDETVAIDYLKKGANDFISKDKIQRLSLTIERELRQADDKITLKQRTEARVRESYDATIEAWGRALELRDVYTKGHTARAADMSLHLALFIGVSHNEFVTLYRGAYLHDIGKMAIPDSILLKRDMLTEEEMNIMKKHPIIACDMLKHVPFLKPCLDIVCYHHERWDGSGYPDHLVGTNIPYLARLFAVVDVYDALTTDRPYRPSWEKSKAIAYLLDEAGHTFDPEIVHAFVDMVGRA